MEYLSEHLTYKNTFYQSTVITLTYEPETDILIATWTNGLPLSAGEVHESMHKVIEAINVFQCRKIVIDASNAVALMEDACFKSSLAGFINDLRNANIKKLARIITSYPAREEIFNYLQNELSIPFQLHDFNNKKEAIKWLILNQ